MIVNEGWRFHSQPMVQFDNYIGIEKNLIVRDNYELGYYVFPIVVKNEPDKQLFYEMANFNFYTLDKSTMSDAKFDENKQRLESALNNERNRINTLIIWGNDSRIEAMISKDFEQNKDVENQAVHIFYRRNSSP